LTRIEVYDHKEPEIFICANLNLLITKTINAKCKLHAITSF